MRWNSVRMEDVNGYKILFDVTNVIMNFDFSILRKIITLTPTIFQVYDSSFMTYSSLFSNFYPQLIYTIFTDFTALSCVFMNSSEYYEIYEIGTLKFEYNTSFRIENCIFMNIKNKFKGPVKSNINILNIH